MDGESLQGVISRFGVTMTAAVPTVIAGLLLVRPTGTPVHQPLTWYLVSFAYNDLMQLLHPHRMPVLLLGSNQM